MILIVKIMFKIIFHINEGSILHNWMEYEYKICIMLLAII